MLTLSAAPVVREAAGSPAAAAALAYADARTLPKQDNYYHRWLWVSSDPKKRDDFLVVLKAHLNLLSTQSEFGTPVLIAPDVVRIDLRDYGLQKKLNVWEKFADNDVFFHAPVKYLKDAEVAIYWPGGYDPVKEKDYERGWYDVAVKAGTTRHEAAPWLPRKEIDGLRAVSYSESPILMAEWFFVQTARQVSIRNKQEGTGYYDFLGLKSRDDFFKLTGTDEKKAIDLFKEWRAVVERSGISQQNRQIVGLGAVTGRVWGTLDTFTQAGKGQAKRNLRRGEFAHDAEEWYGFLANGLPITFLANAKGEAQESAPDKIGPDDSALRVGKDARVHANLSCIRCHGVKSDMLQPVSDWARRTFRQGGVLQLADKDKEVTLELKRQYLSDLDRALRRDREDYADAVARVTQSKLHPKGLTSAQFTKLYGEAWNRYVEDQISAADAARELGTTEARLVANLKKYAKARGGGDLILAAFIDEPAGKLSRLEWEDSYALAATVAAGLNVPEVQEKREKDGKK